MFRRPFRLCSDARSIPPGVFRGYPPRPCYSNPCLPACSPVIRKHPQMPVAVLRITGHAVPGSCPGRSTSCDYCPYYRPPCILQYSTIFTVSFFPIKDNATCWNGLLLIPNIIHTYLCYLYLIYIFIRQVRAASEYKYQSPL